MRCRKIVRPRRLRLGKISNALSRCLSSLTTCGLLLVTGSLPTQAACIEQTALLHSVASISRAFNDEEKKADPGLLAVRGTAWFLSPGAIVTAGHVADAMKLSAQTWREIEIAAGDDKLSVPARLVRLAGSQSEKIAVLELRAPFPGAQGLTLRLVPLRTGEQLISLAYPSSQMRFTSGRFVEYGTDGQVAGTALIEMYDGSDRLALDHGASGAPVLDCKGEVVAVVSNVFTKTMRFMSQVIRVSTAWGSPNVASVPISVLKNELAK